MRKLAVVLIFVGILVGGASAYTSPSEEVLYFTMNDSCPANDISGSGITGTCVAKTSSVQTGVSGKFDTSYNFNGESYVNFGTPSELSYANLGNTVSVNVWLNLNSNNETTDLGRIVNHGSSSGNDNFNVGIKDTEGDGKSELVWYTDVGGSNDRLETDYEPPANTWIMVTAVMDGQNREIFIDNSSIYSDTNGGYLTSASGSNWSIGSRDGDTVADSLSTELDGKVDEVRIYDGVFNQTQIDNLYNNNKYTQTTSDPANFSIIDTYTEDVYEGNPVEIEATINNTGELTDTQDIELDLAGVRDTESLTLDGGESANVTLTHSFSSGSWFYTVQTDNDSEGVSVEVLDRVIEIKNINYASTVDYWKGVSDGFNLDWDIGVLPDGTSFQTTVQGDTFTGSSNQTFSNDLLFSSSTTGSVDFTIEANTTNYDSTDKTTQSVTINDPRHSILSTTGLKSVHMTGNSESYNYTFQTEIGEDVDNDGNIFTCSTGSVNYTSDGLCDFTITDSETFSSTGSTTVTETLTGQSTGFTDSLDIGSVDVYDPSGTYDENPTGTIATSNAEQNISFTWDSTEEDVQAFLYFNGNQIQNKTLSSGDRINDTVTGNEGQNTYYVEVEGQTSGDTYTFSTQSFEISDASIDISIDRNKFGNSFPLGNSPYYNISTDVDRTVDAGKYKLDWKDIEWDTSDDARYYGWETRLLDESGGFTDRVESDNLIGDGIGGRVLSSPEVQITYSHDQLDSDGTIDIEVSVDSGGSSLTVQKFSGDSSSSESTTIDLSGFSIDNNLSLDVENNLDKDLTIEEVQWTDVQDRSRVVQGEEFRAVTVNTTLIDPADLEFWFNIDGSNATALQNADNVDSSIYYRNKNTVVNSDFDRGGLVATWDKQNRKDTFTLPSGTNNYGESIPNAPRSVTINTGANTTQTIFFFDTNDRITNNLIEANGTLYVTDGSITESVNFTYSSDVDFQNFRSTSNVKDLDTTLSFDSESTISTNETLYGQDPLKIENIIQDGIEIDDPQYNESDQVAEGQAVQFRNVHSRELNLYLEGDLVGTVKPQNTVEIVQDVAPSIPAEDFRDQIVSKELLYTVEASDLNSVDIKDLDIDGSKLERGTLTATYYLIDEFHNDKEVEKEFKIRENTISGNFYQTFDNTFQWDSWIPGLLLFLLLVAGGFLYIDWKMSLMMGLAFAVITSVALLWTGLLPLEINLLIVVLLAGGVASVILKVIS